jgi:hypothetical protein
VFPEIPVGTEQREIQMFPNPTPRYFKAMIFFRKSKHSVPFKRSSFASCLARRLRGDRLKEMGEAFKIGRYRTVRSIGERMEVRIGSDEMIRKKFDPLIATIQVSQEQT